MIKKLGSILFSTRTMGMLLLLYAFSMAMGTFVENDYGTPVAKALIYNCWWFELIMLILVINFIGNIGRYKLYQLKKLPLLVFHLAFVIIFIGGFITRYISFEGSMPIREGESSDRIISDATFFKVQIGNDNDALAYDDVPVTLLSDRVPTYLKPFKKTFSGEYDFRGERVKLKVVGFYPRAQDSLVQDASGLPTLHLVVLENGQRVNKYIPSGNVQLIQNMLFSFNKETKGAINITDAGGKFQISSPYEGNYMIMATQERKVVTGNNEVQPFNLRSLYTYGTLAFVVPEAATPARIMRYEGDKKTHENDPDLIEVAITTSTASDTVSFYGGKGMTNFQHQSTVGGLRISLAYGSKVYTAPFSLKLVDFKMEKYPGSDSPSAYSSDVMIQSEGKETPYKIYMNHVLDHSGYRFFQSSFDPDELGTILSVNHDAWGTNITYIGYTLLFLGMFVTLFWKGTHFSKLNEQLRSLSKSKATLVLLMLLPLGSAYSQKIDMHGTDGTHQHSPGDGHDHAHEAQGQAQQQPAGHEHTAEVKQVLSMASVDAKSFAETVKINPQHAEQFGSLLVQNIDGRIERSTHLPLRCCVRSTARNVFIRWMPISFYCRSLQLLSAG